MITVVLGLLFAYAFAVELISTGSTVALDGVPYYIPSTPYVRIPNFQSQILAGKGSGFGGIVPVTVVKASSATFTLAQLDQTLATYGTEDDVWQESFLSGRRNSTLWECAESYALGLFSLYRGREVAEFSSYIHPI